MLARRRCQGWKHANKLFSAFVGIASRCDEDLAGGPRDSEDAGFVGSWAVEVMSPADGAVAPDHDIPSSRKVGVVGHVGPSSAGQLNLLGR